ncbi:carboxymuconolactone decarboxylase family protein [Actinomadura sp. ATCC 31491]|uniref:Carboxymuconolactone decarboxylase family protein n=1 Tax=Actinomadura luzonensis TaxID=2805427 RepID=A0ABT0FP56_9ACTN|nr:carboxymuconolactone decarboxylase family protein [Actinomadura luzonensis]MCK2214100.1 carboxymuconolactone decarboxylase family protein [Actinomadura luzonensis]
MDTIRNDGRGKGQFRYVTPVPPEAATGRVAEVYAQLAEDFGMARMPVFLTLSPAPEVLAATWALLRESLLAGEVARTGKEVVALGVSLANRCPFCVAAHTTLLHATGDHRLAETVAAGGVPDDPGHARLLAWAKERGPAPFPDDEAPEYLGTALTFHFVNRMASALLTENLLPGNLQKSRLVRSLGGRAMSRAVRRRLPPGASLPLVADLRGRPEPGWAARTPVGVAYAALRTAARDGGHLLGDAARAVVAGTVAAWDGEHPPMGGAWLDGPLAGLPAAERPAARLALLAALAPYRVTDPDVAAWRTAGPAVADMAARRGGGSVVSDADLVRLVAFGAILATERAETLITRPATLTPAKGRS